MYGMKKARVLRVEAGRRPVGAEVIDRSPWDWYAQSCSCGLPPGECRASPSPHEPAPARRRLASVGLCGRARGGQDARRRLLGAEPRRDRHHEARLSDRPDHGRHPRRHGRWPLRASGGRSTVVPAGILAFEAPRFLAQRGPRGLPERRKARARRGANIDTMWADDFACWHRAEATWDSLDLLLESGNLLIHPTVHAAEGRLSDLRSPAPRRRVDRLPGRRPSRRRHDRRAPRRRPRRLSRGLGATAQPPLRPRWQGPGMSPDARLDQTALFPDRREAGVSTCC